jgi:hypothetical protein
MSHQRMQKKQREKERRERTAAKQARRQERRLGVDDPDQPAPVTDSEQAALLAELAALHERFAAGSIDFEAFTDAKDELVGRLHVE